MKERMATMQTNGGGSINWAEFIFGSKNFSDLITRMITAGTIQRSDQELFEDYEATRQSLKEAQASLKEERTSLLKQQKALEVRQAQLEKKMKQREARIKELEDKNIKFESQIFDLQEIEATLIAQEEAIAAEIEAQRREEEEARRRAEEAARQEAARKAEEARQAEAAQAAAARQAEEARAAAAKAEAERAAAQKQQNNNNNTQSSSSSNQTTQNSTPAPKPAAPAPKPAPAPAPKPAPTAPTTSAPAPSGAMFIQPTTGRFSQGWGPASGQFGYSFHNGVDIAGPVGTPIRASATGTVIRAGWGGAYGNHVMIAHVINGQVWTTVYAHLNSVSVSAGQRVTQGSNIGGLGNTGNSSGPHLHFEIHQGSYSYSGTSAGSTVNPRQFF
ncbi:MAG: peptidoglycan DD-metalloendopeptidase family protein, partial [Exiguobacterium chiriqhucha]